MRPISKFWFGDTIYYVSWDFSQAVIFKGQICGVAVHNDYVLYSFLTKKTVLTAKENEIFTTFEAAKIAIKDYYLDKLHQVMELKDE